MKKLTFVLFLILLSITFFTSCDPTRNDPIHAELRLVPLTTGDLAKALVREDGNQYLPLSELGPIMAKAASADIDFGNMAATRTLQYVLMNVGNTDVYDITFVSNDLNIHPTHIPLIPTQGEGGDLIALPIVSFTKEHVIPLSGVGALLDIETGTFNDVMTLCYNYDLSHSQSDSIYYGDSLVVTDTVIVDSFDIADEYTVMGVKAGALIDIITSDQNICDAVYITPALYDAALTGTVLEAYLYSSDMSSMQVQNNGNVPLRMRVINPYVYVNGDGSTVLDTVLQPAAEIDVSGIIRGERFFDDTYDPNKGNVMILGADRNQPYIFEVMGHLCIDGEFRIMFTEAADS
ncbi:MAG: hypothetical protein K9N05_02125 [Candidatus Marinimicrobia bacterium]|nr:hypothetical protein [Candidatus Neomarinimicrobiota bacterium]